ncbi:hypothetical protein [Methanopyrus sp.]
MRSHLCVLSSSLVGMAAILLFEHSIYAKAGGVLLLVSSVIFLVCARLERALHRTEQLAVVAAILLILGVSIHTLRAGHL